MESILNQIIVDLHSNMLSKLDTFWPNPRKYFPPEANLSLEIARLGLKYEYDVYGEVNVGDKKRRDLLLINNFSKWICQVEVKLVNIYTCRAVINDLKRVKSKDDLDTAMQFFSKKIKVEEYSKFGLFVGGDFSWWYAWWLGTSQPLRRKCFMEKCRDLKKVKSAQEILDELNSALKGSINGVYPKNPKERKLWIAYALYEL